MNLHATTAPAALTIVAALGIALGSAAPPQDLGFSYLRIEVEGHHIVNFVQDERYQGWLKLEAVEAHSLSSTKHSTSKGVVVPQGKAPLSREQEDALNGWVSLEAFLKSRPGQPGKIQFGAGDNGGMEPMFNAMTHHTIIPEADLVYYDLEKNVFIGKYKLKGIRVLSLEDFPASACAMYEITLSFHSISKE